MQVDRDMRGWVRLGDQVEAGVCLSVEDVADGCVSGRSSAGMKLLERSSAPAPHGHLGSDPYGSHMPLPDRDTEM